MSDSRFSTSTAKFVSQIDVLDDLQNEPGTPPNPKKYLDWHWNSDENLHVTEVRTKADELFNIIKNKRSCPPEVKDEMKVLIRDFMAYDHGKTSPHHLLDKIADFGTLLDCETAGVKRGTPLAKTPSHGGDQVKQKMLIPQVSVRSNVNGQHLLDVVNPGTPESHALPEGMKAARVCRYIGTEPPDNIGFYKPVGNAKRGLFLSRFADQEPPEDDKKLYAWYYAYYESTKGEFGDPSSPVKAEIILQTP
jgi:hypothetical protein